MMTREEAIEALRKIPVGLMDLTNEQKWNLTEALDLALSALRTVSRERVEKVWRSHWNESTSMGGFVYCSRCGYSALEANNYTFCPKCGRPFTDEAVQVVMERLERLRDE